MKLQAGWWLHFSCSDEWVGPIVKAYDNEDGDPVIDIDVADINEFVFFEDYNADQQTPERYWGSLTRIEPAAVRIVELCYKLKPDEPRAGTYCELRMPEGGCYRCTTLCSVHHTRSYDDHAPWEPA